MSITQKWKKRLIGNFEYLQHLNTLAGRSYNDLTQYPVFPFIISNYSSEEINLNDPKFFRDLSKPMGALDNQRLEYFRKRYQELIEMDRKPFLYGSHYSNMGIVLHYMVRVEPFTTYHIEFQGGKFDLPDRSFYNLENTYRSVSSTNTSDVKELTPEFFYLPEFLQNKSNLNFGETQSGIKVDNVILPKWVKKKKKFKLKTIFL